MNSQNTNLGVTVGITRKLSTGVANLFEAAKKKGSTMSVIEPEKPQTRLSKQTENLPEEKPQVAKKPTR